MDKSKSAIASLQRWANDHAALTGLLGAVLGLLLGIAIPIWQTYLVDVPRLGVEIYAIDRQISSDARIPSDDDALSVLVRNAISLNLEERLAVFSESVGTISRGARRSGYTPKEAADLLARAKAEQKALPERIEERQRQLRDVESQTSDRITLNDVSRLNGPLPREFKTSAAFSLPTPDGQAERQKAIDHFKAEYTKRLDEYQKRYTELQTQLPAAERRIEELKKELDEKKSFFQITAILSNPGRKSVSVRQHALLRVYIGKGNYVDLKLNLSDYKTAAEVTSSGTRLAVFSSDLLEAFTDGASASARPLG